MIRMLFAVALALAASPALAADLPAPNPPPPPQAPSTYVPVVTPEYNWGGIYIGANGGYGFGQSNWGAPVSTGNFNLNGGVAGGTIGANFQTSQFVFGVEGDFDWAGLTGSNTVAATCAAATSCATSDQWLGTLRGRAGYAFDRVLVYGTAGGAFGDVKATLSTVGSTDSTEFGWTAGAGVEVGLTDNITAKLEYLFVDLQSGSCSATVCGTANPVSFQTSLVRAGLNFKFNPF